MRAIEFRAWHVPTQRLFVVHSFTSTRVYELLEVIDAQMGDVYTEAFRREDCVLQQFTGLIDPNGVKIFEGDITYFDYQDPDDPTQHQESYYRVVFWQGGFGLAHLDDVALESDPCWFTGYQLGKPDLFVEPVVGHIHALDALPPLTKYAPSVAEQVIAEREAPEIRKESTPAEPLGKKELCDAHKALLAWQNALDAITNDPDKVADTHAYQVHFTWLSTLQGLGSNEKNDLFIKLRDRAAANRVLWDSKARVFFTPVVHEPELQEA